MAQVVNLTLPSRADLHLHGYNNNNNLVPQKLAQKRGLRGIDVRSLHLHGCASISSSQCSALQLRFHCNGRFSCLFSHNRKQEQARKALESALGGNKEKFEKWSKEIRKREEAGGGGDAGGGGWFGWGGRFGWSNGDHFWQEAQQTSLAVLGIIFIYLVVAKGDLLLAVIFNPLLFALRGTRNSFAYMTSQITKKLYGANGSTLDNVPKEPVSHRVSAKERVVKKWGIN